MKSNKLGMAIAVIALLFAGVSAHAQFNWQRALQGGAKLYQAATLTDEQMAELVKESVDYMDAQNPVAEASDPYMVRLVQITDGLEVADGIPLNFKVYKVTDVNAFACADGSVRVFAGIMDLMTDDELLGIIGHEVGHVALHHSKNAFKKALLNEGLKDGLASLSTGVAKLTDSQMAQLTGAYLSSKYSRQQETAADDFAYEFLKYVGKNPWAMASAFEKMQQLEQSATGSASSGVALMFSSHPETSARIERIEQHCLEDGIQKTQTPAPAATTVAPVQTVEDTPATEGKHAPKTNLEIHF